jgi:hypothetical protein
MRVLIAAMIITGPVAACYNFLKRNDGHKKIFWNRKENVPSVTNFNLKLSLLINIDPFTYLFCLIPNSIDHGSDKKEIY